jgi:hypothetical protein
VGDTDGVCKRPERQAGRQACPLYSLPNHGALRGLQIHTYRF